MKKGFVVADSQEPLRLHRRQFVISDKPFRVAGDWQCVHLAPSAWMSHCPELRVSEVTDKSGASWFVLGLAVETSPQRASPRQAIAGLSTEAVPQTTETWAGRWALVGPGRLYTDASGLLGCLYGPDAQGRLCVSSSPALLLALIGPDLPVTRDRLRYEAGISWYPPPQSRHQGIARLLPSQVLCLQTGRVLPRRLLPEINPGRNLRRQVAEIQRTLVTTLTRLAAETRATLWLGLTAGFDSRALLAASHAAGINVMTFTRINARVPLADLVLPPLLAGQAGFDHRYFRPRSRRPDRRAIAESHSANQVSDGDAVPLTSGVRDAMDGISFGGHAFAIAGGFANWRSLPELPPNPEAGARAFAALMGEPQESAAVAGISEWLTWVHETPHGNLDWRDRLFLEQRCAGWLSAKEQLYDLTKLERFPVLNCANLYRLILELLPADRADAKLQLELIRNWCPPLLEKPFNPSSLQTFVRHPLRSRWCLAERKSIRAVSA